MLVTLLGLTVLLVLPVFLCLTIFSRLTISVRMPLLILLLPLLRLIRRGVRIPLRRLARPGILTGHVSRVPIATLRSGTGLKVLSLSTGLEDLLYSTDAPVVQANLDAARVVVPGQQLHDVALHLPTCSLVCFEHDGDECAGGDLVVARDGHPRGEYVGGEGEE